MTNATGRFVWFEYVSQDPAKAQGWFGELFGWSTRTMPMPDGDYAMIAEGMGAVGLRVTKVGEIAGAIRQAQQLNANGKTVLIDIKTRAEDRRVGRWPG